MFEMQRSYINIQVLVEHISDKFGSVLGTISRTGRGVGRQILFSCEGLIASTFSLCVRSSVPPSPLCGIYSHLDRCILIHTHCHDDIHRVGPSGVGGEMALEVILCASGIAFLLSLTCPKTAGFIRS